MTDLPQLQTLLVDAAVKRRRRRRVRRAVVPLAALACVLAVLPWAVGDLHAPDPETPAPTVAPAPSVQEAFGAFRAPTESDPLPLQQPGARVRSLGRPGTAYRDAYLLVRGSQLCLVVSPNFFQCDEASELVTGHKILFRVVGGRGYAVLPNGVQDLRREWTGFEPAPFTVSRNLVVFTAPAGGGRLDWIAPDGTRANLVARDPKDPRSYYPRLNEPERAADRLDPLLGGARQLIADEARDVHAWLVPRRATICLVVRTGDGERSGCRPGNDVAKPLVVSAPARPQTVVVAAFPVNLLPLEVTPATARSTIGADGLLVLDGADLVAFQYRDTKTGDEPRLYTPFNIDGYVLNGVEKPPINYMPG